MPNVPQLIRGDPHPLLDFSCRVAGSTQRTRGRRPRHAGEARYVVDRGPPRSGPVVYCHHPPPILVRAHVLTTRRRFPAYLAARAAASALDERTLGPYCN